MEFGALLLFLFPLAYSPGPGNMLFAANGARFGFRSTLPATLGYHLATLLVTTALGMGFSTAVGAAPRALLIVQLAGSLYVLYLAWSLWRSGSIDGAAEARPLGFWGGAVLLVLNPKAYVIIALMFSQFLPASSDLKLVAAIALVFTLNNLLAFSLWTLVGDALARVFRNDSNARLLNRVFGLMLGLVGLWMLLS
ncbi:MAG: LysE family translocator [Pseudomonadota bacterium]